MTRIQKASVYLLSIFNILLIVLPLKTIMPWILVETGQTTNDFAEGFYLTTIQTPEKLVKLSEVDWTLLSETIAISSSILGILPLFLSLFVLKAIFHNYKNGEIFSMENTRYYSRLGWLFFLNALLIKPISDSLMVLAVTLSNPPGHRYITIGFGTPNLEAIFCGIIVIVISWVMSEASKLHNEQKYTI